MNIDLWEHLYDENDSGESHKTWEQEASDIANKERLKEIREKCLDWGSFLEVHDELKGSVLDYQEGGDHYKLPIQPIEYITKNNLGYIEGNVVKYITRWKNKNGVEDLKKAKHYIEMLIERADDV